MSTLKTIDKIEQNLANIRSAVNETKGETMLTNTSLLSDYADAIRQLGAQIASTSQQLIVLYTYAANDEAATLKTIPAVSWPKSSINEDGEEEGGKVIINVLDENGWVPTSPIKPVGENSRLYIRFASIFYGESEIQEKNLGIPILLEGKDGEQGPQGDPGTDAVVIGLTQFRTMTLYNTQANKPNVPEFKFDTDQFVINNGDLIDYLYYVTNSGKKYIKADDSEWKLSIPDETYAWEISISFKSSHETVDILSGPLYSIPAISETKIEYCLSETETVGNEWMENRPAISNEYPYLFYRIKTKYTTGYEFYSTPILLEEMPIVILNIETLYGVSSDVSIQPVEWSPIVTSGPVIWKKETTTYNRNVGENSNVNVAIEPISIQGPAGIQIIDQINSVSELPTSLTYDSSYIGRIGVIVQSDTYIWYGSEDPNLGCEQIGEYYWLNVGPLGNGESDWNANEGETGYIKNRTHFISTKRITEDFGLDQHVINIPRDASNITVECIGENSETYSFASVDTLGLLTEYVEISDWESSEKSKSFYVEWNSDVYDIRISYSIPEIFQLDPKFCNKITNVTYDEINELCYVNNLIPYAKYRITDYPNLYIIVEAISNSRISKCAQAVHKSTGETFEIEYTLDNNISASYTLDGEPFQVVISGMNDDMANSDYALIKTKFPEINFAKLIIVQNEAIRISIESFISKISISWTPGTITWETAFDRGFKQYYADGIEPYYRGEELIYLGHQMNIDVWMNSTTGELIQNNLVKSYADITQTNKGTILKFITNTNELPFDPNFYNNMVNSITGKWNKVLPYYDSSEKMFIVAPICFSANNAVVSLIDAYNQPVTDNQK